MFPTNSACEVGKFRLCKRGMENELRLNLLHCAETYAKQRGIGLPTLGRMAAGDWRFFDRLRDDAKTFTARKYDEVLCWFSENWPTGAKWPKGIERPRPKRGAAA